MSEERLKILEMLNEGKITSDEAATLLKQVGDTHERPYHYHRQHWGQWPPQPPEPPEPPQPMDFGWINDLRFAIEETARNVMFPDDFFGGNQEKFTADADVGNGIRELVFEGKNATVQLNAYSGDRLEVEAYYKTKGGWSPRLSLTQENGVFSLSYDDNALYSLGINVRVPETAHIGSVRLKSKNASVSVDDIEAEKMVLATKNGAIKVSDSKGEYLHCETRNSSIVLDDVKMREIDAQTSNSKIALDDVDAFRARLATSNAKIDVKDSNIVQLNAKTSNSALKFDNLGYNEQEPLYSIDASTTNGQISVRLPHREIKCRLRASTTLGGVFSELSDLEYHVNEKNYVEAQSSDYETVENKLNLSLQTTNGGIYIRQ